MDIEAIKATRHDEAATAASLLGANLVTFDAGDYPLEATTELRDRLAKLYRTVQPTIVLTHTT